MRIAESQEMLSMIMETTDVQAQMEDRVLVCVRDGKAVICGDADSRENIIAFDTGTFGTYALASRSLIPEPDTESEDSIVIVWAKCCLSSGFQRSVESRYTLL